MKVDFAEHDAKHGPDRCENHTYVVFDFLMYCRSCGEPMEHHCCHRCCPTCGVVETGGQW